MHSWVRERISNWFQRLKGIADRLRTPARAAWLLFALPGLYHIGLMLRSFAGRLPYGYDLEWMESGMLTQALRISQGHTPYEPPSIDFVAHLYTPLYPLVMALFSPVGGVTYQFARGLSILSILVVLGLLVATAFAESEGNEPQVPLVAAAVGAVFVSVGYPFTDGWYDLVRADSFMLALAAIGLYGLRAAPVGDGPIADQGWRQFVYPRTALWAAVLGIAFFAKQTAIFFVAAGGAALLFIDWRAVASYVVAAGSVGFGGVGLLHLWTGGWSWTYMYGYHQHHGSSSERFWNAFGTTFDLAPTLWLVTAATLVASLAWWAFNERDPRSVRGVVYWSWIAAVSCLVASVGMSTQWAARNAFMPAIVFGSFATTAAIVALGDATHRLDTRLHHAVFAVAVTLCGSFALSNTWQPNDYIPSEKHADNGPRLVEAIEQVDGEVFTPYFPWYAHLAEKDVHAHLMGLKDVNFDPTCDHKKGFSKFLCPRLTERATRVAGVDEALRNEEFGAVFIGAFHDLRRKLDGYRRANILSPDELPLPPTGWQLNDIVKFTPEIPSPDPANGRVLFDDFEDPDLPGWNITGDAWGSGPVTSALPNQGPVGGYFGDRFMNSFHGRDASTGVALSPIFRLENPVIRLRVGGGRGDENLRVELREASGEVLKTATGRKSEMMEQHTWRVDEYVGQELRIALVDRRSDGWGHLIVDAIRTTDQ
jgi:hypothetical protein